MANGGRFTARFTVLLLLSGATCLTFYTNRDNIDDGGQFTHPQPRTVKTNHSETLSTDSANQSKRTTMEKFAFTNTLSKSTSSVTLTVGEAVNSRESLVMSLVQGRDSTELSEVHVDSQHTRLSTVGDAGTTNTVSVSPQNTSRKTDNPETHTYVQNLTLSSMDISACFHHDKPLHVYAYQGFVSFNIDDFDVNRNPRSMFLNICTLIFHVPNGLLVHVHDLKIRATWVVFTMTDPITGSHIASVHVQDEVLNHRDIHSYSQSVSMAVEALELGMLGLSFQFRFTAALMSSRPQLEVVLTSPAGGFCILHIHSYSQSVSMAVEALELGMLGLSFQFRFTAAPMSSRPQLEVVLTSPAGGYVQTPGWDGKSTYPTAVDSWVRVEIPIGHSVLISFQAVDLEFKLGSEFDIMTLDKQLLSWYDASVACHERGGYLASLTPEEYLTVIRFLVARSDSDVYIGLQSPSPFLPRIYQSTPQWVDRTIAYYAYVTTTEARQFCAYFSRHSVAGVLVLKFVECSSTVPYTECPAGHVTHDFLACDLQSDCWSRDDSSASCPAPLFTCTNGFERVHYTFVCDYRPDCGDGSDENFCVFPPCRVTEFSCGNKQCLPLGRQCDSVEQCVNGADEKVCKLSKHLSVTNVLPPASMDFVGGKTDLHVLG
ncbi:hypothetical protein BaRGS_00035266 [Batillaria attramentaria]|uniref:C-type lectin domain-containing protein n=1 Tax=Batillaria attramentaria TaxID=370345 RepID=A0ABD0JF15_9CAEN